MDEVVIVESAGTGTALVGNPGMSLPFAEPASGTDDIAGFRTLDFGRPWDFPGVAVGISSPAVSDGGGWGFHDGLVALAASPATAEGEGVDDVSRMDEGEVFSAGRVGLATTDAAEVPDSFPPP
jgi:hypothetical protein